jgi:hypothetical protein
MNSSELLTLAVGVDDDVDRTLANAFTIIVGLTMMVLVLMWIFATFEIKNTLHRMETRSAETVLHGEAPRKESYTALSNYRDDYRKADRRDRRIIAETVCREFHNVKERELPGDLSRFLASVRGQRRGTRSFRV